MRMPASPSQPFHLPAIHACRALRFRFRNVVETTAPHATWLQQLDDHVKVSLSQVGIT